MQIPSWGRRRRETRALKQKGRDSLFLVEWLAEGARPLLLSRSQCRQGPACSLFPTAVATPAPSKDTQCGDSSLWDNVEFRKWRRELRQEMLFWSLVPRARAARSLSVGGKDALIPRPSRGRGCGSAAESAHHTQTPLEGRAMEVHLSPPSHTKTPLQGRAVEVHLSPTPHHIKTSLEGGAVGVQLNPAITHKDPSRGRGCGSASEPPPITHRPI